MSTSARDDAPPPSPWARLVRDLKGKGMTQSEIGKHLGSPDKPLSKQAVSDIERGNTLVPGFETALRLLSLHQAVVCAKPPGKPESRCA